MVPRACAEGHRGMPQGREVQRCSPSPSRGSGWVRHAGGVLVEEGVLGFQGCPEGVRNQTTASSEACCWKCPVGLHCRLRQKRVQGPPPLSGSETARDGASSSAPSQLIRITLLLTFPMGSFEEAGGCLCQPWAAWGTPVSLSSDNQESPEEP